jgi:hypothetical protein
MSGKWYNATYPTPVRKEHGCKVSWYAYRTKDEARFVSRLAHEQGQWLEDEGFDFGYMIPGSIRQEDDGLWTVVIP